MGLSKFLPMMQPANMGGGGDLGLFNDAHGFLQGVSAEVGVLKRQIAQNDETRRAEIEELRKELEQERFERRDALNKLRYEFEEFVHRKIDKVIEEVEEMKRVEHRDDSEQQMQINRLIEQVDRLKENLFGIQTAWGSSCLGASSHLSLFHLGVLTNPQTQAIVLKQSQVVMPATQTASDVPNLVTQHDGPVVV